MVIRTLLKQSAKALAEGGNTNAMAEAHWILRSVLDLQPIDLVLKSNTAVPTEKQDAVEKIIKKRISGVPLQYLLGTQEFMSLEWIVTPDVLIPRADTETLVEHVLAEKKNQGFVALDIGTGSGCIALSLAHYNKRAYVRGLDISEQALLVARRNAQKLGLGERATFAQCDIMQAEFFGLYDVIVSNPPYIETAVIPTLDAEVRNFEPHTALDGGQDGMDFYRRIVEIAPAHLQKDGLLAFEVGHTQAETVARMLEPAFANIQIVQDLCGINRVVSGRKKEL